MQDFYSAKQRNMDLELICKFFSDTKPLTHLDGAKAINEVVRPLMAAIDKKDT